MISIILSSCNLGAGIQEDGCSGPGFQLGG